MTITLTFILYGNVDSFQESEKRRRKSKEMKLIDGVGAKYMSQIYQVLLTSIDITKMAVIINRWLGNFRVFKQLSSLNCPHFQSFYHDVLAAFTSPEIKRAYDLRAKN